MLIDTLKFKTRLTEGGFQENEAQALVDAMADASTDHFATKTDISDLRGELKADIQGVRTEVTALRGETKADIQGVRTEIENMRGQMTNTKWIGTTLLAVNLGILGKLLFT